MSWLVFVLATGAHPHGTTAQQASVSIGLDETVVHLRIVPSPDQAESVQARLDGDGDGVVSEGELVAFAERALAKTVLTVDGQVVPLGEPMVSMPTSLLEVRAVGRAPLDLDSSHRVELEVTHAELGSSWFLQPYFQRDLVEAFGNRRLERSAEGHRVQITLAPG